MNEYELRLKSIANNIISVRSTSGSTSTTLMFGVLALLKSKNKINEDDLNAIFEVERKGVENTLESYYKDSQLMIGGEQINKEELEIVKKYCFDYIDKFKDFVIEAANELAPKKRRRKNEKTTNT